MHLDVVDLRAFYDRTKLGRSTKHTLQSALAAMWGNVDGKTVAGFGYATPLLRPFLEPARRVLNLMPGQQGVMAWPRGKPNTSLLIEETQWPIAAGSIDNLVIAHGLETCERPDALLNEIWRVLAPNGSAVFIVPNRGGMWARSDLTPFGYGRPYSMRQLDAQLKRQKFILESHRSTLYAPPSEKRFWLKTWNMWDRVGKITGVRLVAGVLMVEATKQVYIMPKGGAVEAIKRPLEVLEGLTHPKPKPAAGRLGKLRS
jgi:SAM-dependent methyltransferase